jgi:hypothetical protein
LSDCRAGDGQRSDNGCRHSDSVIRSHFLPFV